MLVYDRPINQAEPAAAPTPPRMLAGFSVLELARLLWQRKVAIVGAGLICACAAVMIGKSLTPEIFGDRPALRRSPGIAAGRTRTDAARPGHVRPRHGGRKPGAADHLEQRAAAGDPGHRPRQGSGIRRRQRQGRPRLPARPVRNRDEVRRRRQARPDGGAGNPDPSHQRQEDRPHLHRRHRRLVV